MHELFEEFLHNVNTYLHRNCPSEFRPHAKREIVSITNKVFEAKRKISMLEAMDEMVWYLRGAFPTAQRNLQPLIAVCEQAVVLTQEVEDIE